MDPSILIKAHQFASQTYKKTKCNADGNVWLDDLSLCSYGKEKCENGSTTELFTQLDPSDPNAPEECKTLDRCMFSADDYETLVKRHCRVRIPHAEYREWTGEYCVKNSVSMVKSKCNEYDLAYYQGSIQCKKDDEGDMVCDYDCIRNKDGLCYADEDGEPLQDLPTCMIDQDYCIQKGGENYGNYDRVINANTNKRVNLGQCWQDSPTVIAEQMIGTSVVRRLKSKTMTVVTKCFGGNGGSGNPLSNECVSAALFFTGQGMLMDIETHLAQSVLLPRIAEIKKHCSPCMIKGNEDMAYEEAGRCAMEMIELFTGGILRDKLVELIDGVFGFIPGYPKGMLFKNYKYVMNQILAKGVGMSFKFLGTGIRLAVVYGLKPFEVILGFMGVDFDPEQVEKAIVFAVNITLEKSLLGVQYGAEYLTKGINIAVHMVENPVDTVMYIETYGEKFYDVLASTKEGKAVFDALQTGGEAFLDGAKDALDTVTSGVTDGFDTFTDGAKDAVDEVLGFFGL